MFNKIFKNISLILFIFVSGCSSFNRVPKAINKPQRLQLGETKQTAPIYDVKRETIADVYKPYDESESVKKLFNFSTPVVENTKPKTEEKKPGPEYTAYEEEVVVIDDIIPEKEEVKKDDGILRIAVLLPTQKQNAVVAEDLKNASTMALFDAKSNNTILQFYNTDGTYEGAKEKAKKGYK